MRIPGSPPEASLEEFRGLQIAWPVKDLGVHVIPQHAGSSAAVDGFQLRERLNGYPEGNPPPHDRWGVMCEAGNGRSAGFIDEQQHRLAAFAFSPVIGRYQLVDERSPEKPHQR